MAEPRAFATSPESDAQLVARLRAGSLEALGLLYERHAQPIYRAVLRILLSESEAEDVLQDVFVGLPAALASYTERGSFAAWLRAVAVRTALMVLRRRRTRNAAPAGAASADDLAAPDPTRRIAVERALTSLPETLRIVFVLHEVEGYSHREIAEMLGITATASAVRNHRAWKEIRKRVGLP